jgi:AcrR family transcriptional regulator
VSSKSINRRLTREDWTAEALRVLGSGGLAAVAIEPIAARLGTTKGSGYWHFRGRDDLIAASVARWEQEHTEAVIARVESRAAAIDRLRELLREHHRQADVRILEPGGTFELAGGAE